MTKKEIIKDCMEFLENGADMIEIFEYIEDNSNLDPAEIINTIYLKEAVGV